MKKKFRKHFLALPLAALIALFVFSCVYIDEISVMQVYDGKEVSYVYAGDVATFTINGHIECHEDHQSVNFVAAFLVPKAWKVAENGKATYKSSLADDRDMEKPMSVIPASSLPKNGGGLTWVECLTQTYGVGPNVLDDMEWVVYQTDEKWDIINNQFPSYTIYLRTPVGDQNLKCHIGFFVNHTDDGFSGGNDHKKCMFSNECFEVVGGKGAVLDFCNNHYNKVAPMSSLQNDYVTFSFIGDVADNDLSSTGEVYFEAEAVTTDGKVYKVDEKTEKTLMKRTGAYSGTYTKTLWPVGFFGLGEDEQIQQIHYSFTNKDRSIVITQSDDDFAQHGTELPAEKVPFTFAFSCD
ncbi:MAG: DUF4961 domain-containing protein [Prevotella sp.]